MARKSATPAPAAATAAVAFLALLAAPSTAAAAGGSVGYIPPASQGCPANVKVKIEASSNTGGWFSSPQVAGRATVLNGESYSVPVQDVTIMIFPANSPVAPVYADCRGIGNGQRVPYSPIPYDYGRASCNFQANLPTNGPSAGARNWQQARAVVTLTNGAKCYSDMTPVQGAGGGGGGWPWGNIIGGANPGSSGGMGSSGPGMGMGSSMGGGMGMGSSGPGSMGMGSSGPVGMGSGRMVGGANPTTTSSSSKGGRKMLGAAH